MKESGQLLCSAADCKNSTNTLDLDNMPLHFFKFPKDPERCKKWLDACQRKDLLNENANFIYTSCRICSRHFEDSMFVNDLKNSLHDHALPTLFDVSQTQVQERIEPTIHSFKVENYDNDEVFNSGCATDSEEYILSINQDIFPACKIEEIDQPLTSDLTSEDVITFSISNSQNDSMEFVAEDGSDMEEDVDIMEPDELGEIPNADKLCRICASQSDKFVCIFKEDGAEQKVEEKIHKYLPIKVAPHDRLPLQVCSSCLAKLNICHELVTCCVESDKKLRTLCRTKSVSYNGEGRLVYDEDHNAECLDMNVTEESDEDARQEDESTHEVVLRRSQRHRGQLAKHEKKQSRKPQSKITVSDIGRKAQPESNKSLSRGCKRNIRNHEKGKEMIADGKNQNNVSSVFNEPIILLIGHEVAVSLSRTVSTALGSRPCEQGDPVGEKDKDAEEVQQNCSRSLATPLLVTIQNQANDPNSRPAIGSFEGKTGEQERNKAGEDNEGGNRELQRTESPPPKSAIIFKLGNQTAVAIPRKEAGPQPECVFLPHPVKMEAQAADESAVTNGSSSETNTTAQCAEEPSDGSNVPGSTSAQKVVNCVRVHMCSICKKFFTVEADVAKHLLLAHPQSLMQCTACLTILIATPENIAKHSSVCPKQGSLKEPEDTEASKSPVESERLSPEPAIPSNIPAFPLAKLLPDTKEGISVDASNDATNSGKAQSADNVPIILGNKIPIPRYKPKTEEEINALAKFKCTLCGKQCMNEENLIEHQLLEHNLSLVCQYCGEKFSESASLKKHEEHHTKSYHCDKCNKILQGETALRRHLESHAGKTYKCSQCNKVYKSWGGFYLHKFSHSDARPYLCDVCGKSFKIRSALTLHSFIHKDEATKSKYACEVCGKAFARAGKRALCRRKHLGQRPYTCEICKKSFYARHHLTKHERIHSGETPFNCKTCGKAFKRRDNMLAHEKTHSPYTCKICDIQFTDRNSFLEHRNSHSEEELEKHRDKGDREPFQCKICHKILSTKTTLANHMLLHGGVKPFACDICGKSFATKQTFETHYRFHTGEKRFACDICNQNFYTKTNRDNHRRIHTGEKPHLCSVCGKSFRLLTALKQHKVVHSEERPFACEICTKCFRRRDQLNAHIQTHTGVKPYACDVCHKSFTLQGEMARHRKRHMKKEPLDCGICGKTFYEEKHLKQHLSTHDVEFT